MIQTFEDFEMFKKAIRLKCNQGYKFYVEPKRIVVATDDGKLPVYILEVLEEVPLQEESRRIIFDKFFLPFLGFKLVGEDAENPVNYMLNFPYYFEVKKIELKGKLPLKPKE
jgi:hypothetical protein